MVRKFPKEDADTDKERKNFPKRGASLADIWSVIWKEIWSLVSRWVV